MAYSATVIEVLIASPGDVIDERQAARETILDWNRKFSKRTHIVLQPRMWELDARPQVGSDPQDLINRQFVRDCDLVIAIFWTRLGTKTPRADSGTVEEISEHANAGKPALVYFSSRKVDLGNVDYAQYQAVQAFREKLAGGAILWSFSDLDDFKRVLSDHLDSEIHSHFKEPVLTPNNTTPPNQTQLSDKALALLAGTAKSDNKQFMRMDMGTGPRIWSGDTVFHQQGDPKAAIGWTSAIQELLSAGLCLDINGKGQIFELTQRGFDFLEQGPRDRFNNGTDVYVEATISRESSQLVAPASDRLLKYIVRMPRSLVEGEGIEWNYDFILRDEDFRYQVLTKISNIETTALLDNWTGSSYRIESLEFYEGDPKSLPPSYRQMGGGCSIWEQVEN
jgi:hypothetical protein